MKNKIKVFFGLFWFYLAVMLVWTFVAPMPKWLDSFNLFVIFIASIVLYFIKESKKL